MLRITRMPGDSADTVRLEGKLLEPWLDEASRVVAVAPSPVQLDLAGLRFVDEAGLRWLRQLQSRGAVIVSCSGFVAELLHGESR